MPKKTKKEKLLALYHRKIRLLTPVSIPTPPVNDKAKTTMLDQYFFSDLKKSLLLTILIIGLEISLYFAKLVK